MPGVVTPDTRFGTNYSSNGSQAQQNSYLVNGNDNNDLPLNSPLAVPNPDAVQEVKMVTNTINRNSAETPERLLTLLRSPAATNSTAMRSGSIAILFEHPQFLHTTYSYTCLPPEPFWWCDRWPDTEEQNVLLLFASGHTCAPAERKTRARTQSLHKIN